MTMTKRHAPRTSPALSTLALAMALAACGGDSGPEEIPDDDPLARSGGPSGRRSTQQKPTDRGSADQAAEKSQFASYEKVSGDLRRKLTDDDFRNDPTGTRNRDPFRSYVISQPGISGGRGSDEARDRTEVCDETNSVAIDYSLRDLTLIGIVLRGTKSYALFRDRAGLGYIVHRNECLGSEQAVVRRIGSGFVRLETVPQAAQGTAAATPQEREILLNPEEYDVPPEEELE
jgi:Tfp pilus assembly protein PilP/predicted small lipoprotein YifL